ncbi:DUF423 domain-containing protein [Allosphingosinicella sp.]|uniref:DUF423 domain-containing protein n=1 Tax=Allosphingosinicella sp. TaxID=2823234 RepID=UPI003D70586B
MKREREPAGLLALAALTLALGVALGAFGAHALRGTLTPSALGWWQTAVSYQMWHGLALLALGAGRVGRVALPAFLLGLGTLIFSGSLYLMALTDMRWLGAVTPIGGLLLILGWLLLGWRAWRGLS